jgi:hypothetical protein
MQSANAQADVLCAYCSATLVHTAFVVCESCRTPAHTECWELTRQCCVYGCGSKRCLDSALLLYRSSQAALTAETSSFSDASSSALVESSPATLGSSPSALQSEPALTLGELSRRRKQLETVVERGKAVEKLIKTLIGIPTVFVLLGPSIAVKLGLVLFLVLGPISLYLDKDRVAGEGAQHQIKEILALEMGLSKDRASTHGVPSGH